ncbi:hypothetical protein RJ55_04541 [Drechmeria coniospora]|nr:hypothetical protein RJ55_04541 [Drechmeria coniospora]
MDMDEYGWMLSPETTDHHSRAEKPDTRTEYWYLESPTASVSHHPPLPPLLSVNVSKTGGGGGFFLLLQRNLS